MPVGFNNIDPEQYWKIFTDKKFWDHEHGHEVFDKDQSPGYFRNCSIALWWMLKTLDQPVDLSYIISLRNHAYHSGSKKSCGLAVNASSGIGEHSFSEAGLEQLAVEALLSAESPHDFMLYHTYKSVEGEELDLEIDFKYKNATEVIENILYYVGEKNYVGLRRKSCSVDDVAQAAMLFLENYEREIEQSKTTDDKLTTIVVLIQKLHRYHLFKDGNGRTFCFFLLNRLLIDQGLSPTIVADPGVFTGWLPAELVQEVIKGQVEFIALCRPEEASLSDAIANEIKLSTDDQPEMLVNKQLLQEGAEQFKLLQYNGFSDDLEIFQAAIECGDVSYLKELTTKMNASLLNEVTGCSLLLLNMLKQGDKEKTLDILDAMIDTLGQYEKQSWFDINKYVSMLVASDLSYLLFNNIKPQYLQVNWSKAQLYLIKDYLYRAQELANRLLEKIADFGVRNDFFRKNTCPALNCTKADENNILLTVSDNQIKYKILLNNKICEYELIDQELLNKITEKELGKLKKQLEEPKTEKAVRPLDKILKAKSSRSSLSAKLAVNREMRLYDRLSKIKVDLPMILLELVRTAQQPNLDAAEKNMRIEIERDINSCSSKKLALATEENKNTFFTRADASIDLSIQSDARNKKQ